MPIKDDRFSKDERGQVEVEVRLRIMGHDLEPEDVSRILGLEPTECHKRGDHRVGKSPNRSSAYSEGLWAWRPSSSKSESPAGQLRALVDVLEPKAAPLQRLRKLGLRMDIFIGLFGSDGNFGFMLSPHLLERLGRLGIDIDFDVYCC